MPFVPPSCQHMHTCASGCTYIYVYIENRRHRTSRGGCPAGYFGSEVVSCVYCCKLVMLSYPWAVVRILKEISFFLFLEVLSCFELRMRVSLTLTSCVQVLWWQIFTSVCTATVSIWLKHTNSVWHTISVMASKTHRHTHTHIASQKEQHCVTEALHLSFSLSLNESMKKIPPPQ